jgi:hypothetical protein
MHKLLGMTLGLTATLFAAILLALTAAPPDRLPFPLNRIPSLNALAVGVGCALPCWHGILPGVTPLQEADSIMDADPAFGRLAIDKYGSHDWRLLATPSDENEVILIFDDQAIVTDIQLFGTARAGQVLEVLGKPQSQTIVCAQEQINFGPVDVLIEGIDLPISIDSQVYVTIEIPAADATTTTSMPANERKHAPWQGFRSDDANNDAPCTE